MHPRATAYTLTALTLLWSLAACGDDPVAPPVEDQVITELEYADSLGINLADFTILPSGVYVLDEVVGEGFIVEPGNLVTVTTTGFLADGSVFQEEAQFTLFTGDFVPGFEDAILGMRKGGTRRMIIPPARGYGSSVRAGIPPGSVIIFDVSIDDVV